MLEVMLGGLVARVDGGRWLAVTGAPCPVTVGGEPAAHGQAVWVPPDAELRLGPPATGVRSYVAVAGGIDVEPVLGSRSTDTLAWVGPDRVTDGAVLPVGKADGRAAAARHAAPAADRAAPGHPGAAGRLVRRRRARHAVRRAVRRDRGLEPDRAPAGGGAARA